MRWEKSSRPVQVSLITDSQASIEIIDNTYKIIGMKHTLSPDMDVGLEIANLVHVQDA